MFYSSDSYRQITLQVCGGNYRQNQRRSNYTLTVPYSRLSQTIQRIHLSGGRITGIAIKTGTLAKGVQIAPTSTETPPVETALKSTAKVAAVPATLPELPAAIPAIAPLSRGWRNRRRHSQPSGTARRKNRKKRRTKAKIYLLG